MYIPSEEMTEETTSLVVIHDYNEKDFGEQKNSLKETDVEVCLFVDISNQTRQTILADRVAGLSTKKYSRYRENCQNIENEMKQKELHPLIIPETMECVTDIDETLLESDYAKEQKPCEHEKYCLNESKENRSKYELSTYQCETTTEMPEKTISEYFSRCSTLEKLKGHLKKPRLMRFCRKSVTLNIFILLIALSSIILVFHLYSITKRIHSHLDSLRAQGQQMPLLAKTSETRTAAMFYMDQQRLKDNKLICWNVSESYPTGNGYLKPARDEPCITIPISGMYGIFTAITFKCTKETDEYVLSYVVVVRSGDTNSVVIQKTTAMLPPKELRDESTMQSLSTSAMVTLRAQDRVCVILPRELIELVYLSAIDNYVTIFKMS